MVSLTSQLIALRRLAATENDRALTARRVTSGLNVADAADTTNALGRSRTLTRSTTALSAVQGSLETGIATVGAASSAVAAAGGILGSMRAVLAAARDPGADLGALQSQFTTLGNSLRAGVSGAAFAGVNLLATGLSSAFDAAPTDERGRTYAIGADLSRTRLLDPFGTSGILQRAFDLTGAIAAPSTLGLSGTATQTAGAASSTPGTAGLSGTAATVAGEAADASAPGTAGLSGAATAVAGKAAVAAPSADGLAGSAVTVGGTVGTDGRAVANVGTLDLSKAPIGDRLLFDVTATVNGTATTRTLTIRQRDVANVATLQTALRAAVQKEFGSDVTAVVDDNGQISLATAASGTNQSIKLENIRLVDGDGVWSSNLGLRSSATFGDTKGRFDNRDLYYASVGTPDFSQIDRGDRMDFVVKLDGDETEKKITVNLLNVTDAQSLVDAINAKSTFSSAFAAALKDGEVVFYSKSSSTKIRAHDVRAHDGDQTTSAGKNFGFTTGSGTGKTAVSETKASATTGTAFGSAVTIESGASLAFDISGTGIAAQTITLTKATVDRALDGKVGGFVRGSGRIESASQLALVAQQALTDAGISGVDVAAADGKLKFTLTKTVATGDAINVTNGRGNGVEATRATLTTGSDFAAPVTIARNAQIDLTFNVNGNPVSMSITQADVEAALGGRSGYTSGSGRIGSVDDLARTVRAAMTRQDLRGASVGTSGNRITFTADMAGAASLDLTRVTGTSTATSATATAGSSFASPTTLEDDAEIRFDLTLDSGAARTLRITRATVEAALAGVSGRTPDTGRIADAGQLALVAQRALAEAGISNVSVAASGDRLVFTRAAGAGSLALGNVQAVASTARSATLRTGSDFSGPVTVEPGASIGFDLTVDGGSARRVTIDNATVEAALAGVSGRTRGSGTIADVGQLAQVLGRAFADASVTDIEVGVSGNRVELRKRSAGAGSIELRNVASSGGNGGSATTLETLNLTGPSVTRLNASERATLIDGYLANLDAIAAAVAGAKSHLATVATQLDIQSAHTTRLQTIETGRLNGSVKTDMDRETARQTALDARLALARQALGIVSESRRNVLNILNAGS